MKSPDDICGRCNLARSYAHHCKECGGRAYHRFVKKKKKPKFTLCWHHFHAQCSGLCQFCLDSDCACPHDEKKLNELRERERLAGRTDQ